MRRNPLVADLFGRVEQIERVEALPRGYPEPDFKEDIFRSAYGLAIYVASCIAQGDLKKGRVHKPKSNQRAIYLILKK